MNDLTLDKNYAKGSSGAKIKLIQEWLFLQGINVAIDGSFGPATEAAVKQFQSRNGMTVNGIVDLETFTRLVMPMKKVLQPIPAAGKTIGEMVAAYAEQHLKEHPREVGGQNRGPWVRLYMSGNEGEYWPWCAGFVSFILEQACQSLQKPLPIRTSVSCDSLAAGAREKAVFFPEGKADERAKIKPGALFLVRKTPTCWAHTGIVLRAENDLFHTIEGNTNDEGSAEGYEVCQRIRGYQAKDFILI
jgi:hypothetical protein